MDINITRFYNNPQDSIEWSDGIMGLGWTMHFGRIVVPSAHKDKVCNQSSWSVTTADNPSLEHPDGARELLVLATDGSGDLVTKSNWRVTCEGGPSFTVRSPRGRTYIMDHPNVSQDGDEKSWHTTSITDLHGNRLEFTYTATYEPYIQRIEGFEGGYSDGRVVTFTYADSNGCKVLDTVEANTRIWRYQYSAVSGFAAGSCKFYLDQVELPTGLLWQYDYYPEYADDTPGEYALQRVTYPRGGIVEYDYQGVYFDPSSSIRTIAVSQKRTLGREVTNGTWDYVFEPGSYEMQAYSFDENNEPYPTGDTYMADKTTVHSPKGRTVYVHQGLDTLGPGNVWATGLLIEKQVYSAQGLVETTTNYWGDRRKISEENYFHGRGEYDNDTWAAMPTTVTTTRNGVSHEVRYSGYDAYGNPGSVEETTAIGNEPSRVRNLTYYNDTAKWIVGKLEDEEIVGVGLIDRTFGANGELLEKSTFGVSTAYTYTSSGDIATETNARQKTTTYEDYYRGIPRHEVHPENVVIDRQVNPTGTIASVTNGRRFTTQYTYDGLGRVDSITPPSGNPITVNRTWYTREVTRGDLIATQHYDGFGRVREKEWQDLGSGETFSQTFTYDADGRKTFQSHIGSTLGRTYTLDVLDRVTQITNADGTQRTFDYSQGGIEVVETDERQNATTYLYRAYGHPENDRGLISIDSPESIGTLINRNAIGQVTWIKQGELSTDGTTITGPERSYTYDANQFLESQTNPEVGTITYGRDAVGNMTSKQVGAAAATTYTYDDLDRLEFIDYPTGTPDVTKTYDANNNIKSVSTNGASRVYSYDANDLVTTEQVTIDQVDYSTTYTYNGNGALDTVTYPSQRTVSYAPDAFGRPTQAMPYATSVSYHPSGQLSTMTYANGVQTSATVNDRQWVERLSTDVGAVDLTYAYDGAGNVESITDAIDAANNRTLTYDGVNRLDTAAGAWGDATYDHSAFGDLTRWTRGNALLDYEYSGVLLSSVQNGYGQITDFTYDDYGNIETATSYIPWPDAPEIVEEKFFNFDDAGHLRSASVEASGSTDAVTFDYDGDGNRVTRSSSGAVTHYVFNKGGRLLGEYADGVVADGKEYFYVSGKLVAAAKPNGLPTADAGPDQQVFLSQAVQLDASASSDPDGEIVSYQWQQLSGTSVTLTSATTATPTFTAPSSAPGEPLVFQVEVSDADGGTATDSVSVSVDANTAPIANAGPDQQAAAGENTVLDGTGSSDADGPLNYSWKIVSGGSAASLTDPTSATPTLGLSVTGTHYNVVVELTVTDTAGSTASDTVTVDAVDPTYDSDSDGLPDSWELEQFGDWTTYSGADDPDGDSYTNQEEYASGNDPHTPDLPEAVATSHATPGDSQVVVTWPDAAGAGSYSIYWSTDPGVTVSTGTRIANVESPYLQQGLTNGQTHYYIITAENSVGVSAASPEVSAVPDLPAWEPVASIPTTSHLVVPQIGMDARGNMVAAWEDPENYGIWAAVHRDGLGWSAPTRLATVGSEPDLAINAQGQAILAWRDSGTYYGGRTDLMFSVLSAEDQTWSTPELAEHAEGNYWELSVTQPEVAISNDGTMAIAWAQHREGLDGSSITRERELRGRIYRPGIGWTSDFRVSQPDDPENWDRIYGTPTVGVDDQGTVTFLWTNDQNSIWTAVYEAGGQQRSDKFVTFTATTRLDVAATGYKLIALNGYYKRIYPYVPGTGWGSGQDFGAGQYTELLQARVADDGSALATWVESDSLLANVYRGGTWDRRPTTLDRLSGSSSAYRVDLSAQGTGAAVAAWITEESKIDSVFISRMPPGGEWATPELVSSGSLAASRVTVASDLAGNIAVAWLQDEQLLVRRSWSGSPANQRPIADAGADQTVVEGLAVSLSGEQSSDPDGVISAYDWTQTAGPAVSLSGAQTATPTFTAPSVSSDTSLTFELTVTDDAGVTASDQTNVVVQPAGGDLTAPTTSISVVENKVQGASHFDVTLTANELADTYFRVTGDGTVTAGGNDTTAWQTYSSPVYVENPKKGTTSFDYYSVDTAGNQEATKTEVLQ